MLNQLIQYFVYKTKGHITKTQLVKFLYLADLYAVKWKGKQLTGLDWYYYKHGPWNEDIDVALSQMDGKEIDQESQGNTIFIRPGTKMIPANDLGIPLDVMFILDNIRREWAGSKKLDPLLDYVYGTAPMLAVKEKYVPNNKVKLNLQTERDKLLSELGL